MVEYLEFILLDKTPKTYIYLVYNKVTDEELGTIEWNGAIFSYAFYSDCALMLSKSCLNDISNFIEKLMKERKQKFVHS